MWNELFCIDVQFLTSGLNVRRENLKKSIHDPAVTAGDRCGKNGMYCHAISIDNIFLKRRPVYSILRCVKEGFYAPY